MVPAEPVESARKLNSSSALVCLLGSSSTQPFPPPSRFLFPLRATGTRSVFDLFHFRDKNGKSLCPCSVRRLRKVTTKGATKRWTCPPFWQGCEDARVLALWNEHFALVLVGNHSRSAASLRVYEPRREGSHWARKGGRERGPTVALRFFQSARNSPRPREREKKGIRESLSFLSLFWR